MRMKKSKTLFYVIVIISLIPRIFIFSLILISQIVATIVIYKENSVILREYNDKIENKTEVWQSSFTYNVYYYDNNFDSKYQNNKNFTEVNNNFNNIIKFLNKCSWEDYDEDIFTLKNKLSKDDYFYLVDNSYNGEAIFRLYIYDYNEHTLYYIKMVD